MRDDSPHQMLNILQLFQQWDFVHGQRKGLRENTYGNLNTYPNSIYDRGGTGIGEVKIYCSLKGTGTSS